MKNPIVRHSAVMVATLTLIAGAAVAQAQDRSNQASDQPTSSQRADHQTHSQGDRAATQSRPEASTRNADRNAAQSDHSRAEPARGHEEAPESHRLASAPQGADVDRYRRAHPHAAARCHDGFFTNTSDRARACSKHGGIETWLLP